MSDKPVIWICDDSPTEAALTRASLGSQYEYEFFEDGSIVVERLTRMTLQPDLLLLDWVMPGMAGDEVCRFLRKHEPTKELPIIITTASRVETNDVVLGLASGADDYVARPFAPEELRARVNAALRTRELADASKRERRRLAAINRLAQALLRVSDARDILDALAFVLVGSLCDGCGVLLLPGQHEQVAIAHHRSDRAGAVAAIANIADPSVRAFADAASARAALPPAYHEYIERYGLSALAILSLPASSPLHGVVTLTRDAGSRPFDADDLVTIETCIEYCSLAIQNAMRFDAERLARAQLDAVLQSLPVGILVTDPVGRLTLVNAAASALLPGIDAATSVTDVFRLAAWSTLDGSAIDEAAWHVGDSSYAARMQMQVRTRDGADHTVAVSAVRSPDARGTVTVIEDVTAERAITVERERVAKFQEEMVAIVSHDLRSPLSAFMVGTDILQASTSSPQLVPIIERLRSSGHRMTKIVEQLLDVTHARLGKGIPLQLRDASLRNVLESVVSEVTLANPKTTFRFVGDVAADGHWDPDRLSQVFSNLASNAAHYGKPGGPVVLELSVADQTASVLVKNLLRDNPIPEDQMKVLFDPFQRGRATGRNVGGLGLGLYIVREIVRAHGGTIDVASDAGGTTFQVLLPLRADRSAHVHPLH